MPNLHALLVGLNAYAPQSDVPPLRGCVNDVRALKQALVRRGIVAAANLRTLVDAEATRAAVIGAWRSHLRDRVTPGDTAWVHFSGHGSRARSSSPDELDGFDETLVLWDSRLPSGWDLLDKEIAVLIAEVEARGAQVILFFDCCHAGGATRAERPPAEPAVRACLPDARRRPSSTLLAAPTRSEHGASNALLVAACLETQKAREYAQPGVATGEMVWQGALTCAFLRLLERTSGAATWADAFGVLSAQVRALYPQQTPLISGPASLSIFGGAATGGTQPAALLVLRVDGNRCQLDGGAALGLRPGARVRLYTAESTVLAVVVACTLDTAWCEPDGTSPASVKPGARAEILSFSGVEGAAGVWAGLAELRSRLRTGSSPLLKLARLREATYRVGRPGGAPPGVQICDAAGEPLVWLPAEADSAPFPAKIQQALEHLAIVKRVRGLHNPAPTAPLGSALEVGDILAVRPSRSTLAAFGQATELPRGASGIAVAAPNTRLGLMIRNRSGSLLYVTVLALLPDWSIRRIAPDESPRQALAAGASMPVTWVAPPLPAGSSSGLVSLKLLATLAPLSFDALLLPPLLVGPPRLDAPVRGAGPLENLLDSVRRGAFPVRSADADTAQDMWFVWDLEHLVSQE